MAASITAALLVIGDEILSGRTKDKNIGYIAEYLTGIGVDLSEVRIVPDVEAEIVAAVNALRTRYTYLFTTGGIGPTHDDITADAVAKAFGVAIDIDPRAVAMMQQRYQPGELNEARLRMARIPARRRPHRESRSPRLPVFASAMSSSWRACRRSCRRMLDAVAPSLETGLRMISEPIDAEGLPEGIYAAGLGADRGRASARLHRLLPVLLDQRVPQPDHRARQGRGRGCEGRERRPRSPPSP